MSVCLSTFENCRSQFLLDHLGRCFKLFVSTHSTSCHEFASQFGLAIFYTRKTPKTSKKPVRPRQCLFEGSSDRPLIASGTGEKWRNSVTVGRHRPIEQRRPEQQRRCVCVYARMRACVHECTRLCTCVLAIYDNNILPRLIMIIIKIISHTLMIPPQRVPG